MSLRRKARDSLEKMIEGITFFIRRDQINSWSIGITHHKGAGRGDPESLATARNRRFGAAMYGPPIT